MPLPLDVCEPAEACCTNLHDFAGHILAQAHAAVNACLTEECAAIVAYVTLGDGDDGIVDALTVAFTGLSAKPPNRPGQPWVSAANFTVRLRETGWPVVQGEGDQIVFPDPVKQNAAARHVLARLEAIHRKLVWLARPGHPSVATAERGRMAPNNVPYTAAKVGNMTPLAPRAGVVGGTITVSIEFA